MKALRSPLFLACCLLFIAHQVTQKMLDISIPLADSYLDNLVAMPIILTILLAERQWLFRRGRDYRLTPMEIVVATAYISLISEVVFPMVSSSFRFDWIDILLYAFGSLLFHFFINKPSPAKQQAVSEH